MRKKLVEFDTPGLTRAGMFDTSRTANGIPYFIQDEQGQTVPNPSLVRKRRVGTAGFFIESPNVTFPNGPIWSVSIPGGLGSTKYPTFTLFPNPEKQTFPIEGLPDQQTKSLDQQVRRFFDAAVTLIISGDYLPGPNNTLVPTPRRQKIREFERIAEIPDTEAKHYVDSAIKARLAKNTPQGRRRATQIIASLMVFAVREGTQATDDPSGIGFRELRSEELNPSQIVREFRLGKANLPRYIEHLVRIGAIFSFEEELHKKTKRFRLVNDLRIK